MIGNMRGSMQGAKKRRIREIIGRSVNTIPYQTYRRSLNTYTSVDATITDYQWWDEFRRGESKGYQLASIFAKPIAQVITSYVLGKSVSASLSAKADSSDPEDPINYTNAKINDFFRKQISTLTTLVEDLYALGDQYVIVNSDGSISVISPEAVELKYDPLDYRKIIKATITTVLDSATIVDVYTDDLRTVTIKQGDSTQVFEYDNLIGMIPLVHFANDRGANETHGRPIYKGLLRVFSRYNDLIEKGLDGAEIMGNPFPVFEGMKDVDETRSANSSTDYTELDEDGAFKTRLRFDSNSAILVGEGGSFKFASPGIGFTGDIRDMLKSLFLLVLDYTRIPEVIWGNEMSGARDTSAEQMASFKMYIMSRRIMLEGLGLDEGVNSLPRGGFYKLVDLYLRIRDLTDPNILVGETKMDWQPLDEADKQLRYQWGTSLHDRGLVTDETLVSVSDLVEDAVSEVGKAREENALKASQLDPFANAVNNELNAPIVTPQPVEAI